MFESWVLGFLVGEEWEWGLFLAAARAFDMRVSKAEGGGEVDMAVLDFLRFKFKVKGVGEKLKLFGRVNTVERGARLRDLHV